MDDAEGELDLSADDSLPWLEAEEEEDTAGDLDTTQVVAFVAFLLITGLLFVGAVWYFGNEGGGEVVADGSMIEAPDGPLKERPKDPGGKEFDGTGNVAPVVGEGGTRDGVIATDGNDEAVRDDGVQQDGSASAWFQASAMCPRPAPPMAHRLLLRPVSQSNWRHIGQVHARSRVGMKSTDAPMRCLG